MGHSCIVSEVAKAEAPTSIETPSHFFCGNGNADCATEAETAPPQEDGGWVINSNPSAFGWLFRAPATFWIHERLPGLVI